MKYMQTQKNYLPMQGLKASPNYLKKKASGGNLQNSLTFLIPTWKPQKYRALPGKS